MRFLDSLFHRKSYKRYSDDELISLGSSLINRVITLKMNGPYNKVIISENLGCKYINKQRFFEFIAYNLNRQKMSLIFSEDTYIRICESSDVYIANESDNIYFKDIEDLTTNK